MIRVLGQIEKRGREIPAGDVIGTVREVLSTGLASDAACRRSVRKVRRTDDGPIERAGGDQLFHPGKSAYGFRRIQRTKLIKIQGRRPSMAETLTVTMRRTPASRMAVSSARATSLMTVVGPRP